ncbi:MAG: LacI family DNA-binding transcriptional regulator, partial [Pontiella sp.]
MNSNREISARRITQGDIAHHAGVSASTVSRALQNDPRITKAVRKKILLVSQKLGYQPDPSISALINYRWKSQPSNFVGVVAWITINDEPGELKKNSPEIDLYWEGAQKGAHRFGYRIDEFSIR